MRSAAPLRGVGRGDHSTAPQPCIVYTALFSYSRLHR